LEKIGSIKGVKYIFLEKRENTTDSGTKVYKGSIFWVLE